jgi:hypothetical protein
MNTRLYGAKALSQEKDNAAPFCYIKVTYIFPLASFPRCKDITGVNMFQESISIIDISDVPLDKKKSKSKNTRHFRINDEQMRTCGSMQHALHEGDDLFSE